MAYIGQNVPFQDLSKFLQEIDPLAVVLVGMRRETALALKEWPVWIPQRDGKPAITFGGRGFFVHPELQAQVAGTYLGYNLPDGIIRLEELLH